MPTPSGSTSVLHLPYLLETDIPDVATASQLLAEAIETDIIAVSNTPFVVPAAYSVPGPLAVAAGANNFLPGFFVPVPVGQTVELLGVRATTRSGSCVLHVTQNGSTVTGLDAINANTTPATTDATGTDAVADGDEFAIVIDSVTSTPDGLSVTLFLSITPG